MTTSFQNKALKHYATKDDVTIPIFSIYDKEMMEEDEEGWRCIDDGQQKFFIDIESVQAFQDKQQNPQLRVVYEKENVIKEIKIISLKEEHEQTEEGEGEQTGCLE